MTTSEHSQAPLSMDGVDATSSPADFPVSPTVWPGTDEATRMTVHSGRKWLALLTSADRPTFWLRTYLASSRWRSTACLLTWKLSATPRGRLLLRLSLSTPRTDAIGSGLLPTPMAADGMRGSDTFMRGNPTVRGAAQLWPTPNAAKAANDVNLQKSGDGRQTPNKLGWAVASGLFPTMVAHDTCHRMTKYAQGGTPLSMEAGGPLNPAWVEWLMGYPGGWTDLEDSEMPSSPRLPTKSCP